jgi:Zn-dependent metalloprotease
MNKHIHGLNCIVPPHMMSSMLANGSDSQKQVAIDTINTSAQMRNQRQMAMNTVAIQPPVAVPGKHRTVYSADNGATLPGRLVRDEGAPQTGDPAADEAYEGAGATYDLYWEVYQRNSLDNRGLRLDATVHYQTNYDNAFWNGQQMVYGDGDGQLFKRFTFALDVIGHELTHGVTQYLSGLSYQGQPGALNESLSDVFGSLVKQRKLGQTAAQADWLIGQGLFTPNVKGVALRSMKAPGTAYDDPVLGKDPQPGTMSGYVNTASDNGGVHINSGIPNHAFYLAAITLGGYAWEKAGQIWYVTARDKLISSTDFQGVANLTYQTAGDLYGQGSPEQQAVQSAWQAVGLISSLQPQPPQPQPIPPQTSGCFAAPAALIRSLFAGNSKH